MVNHRGGKPGNQNARKHGLRSLQYPAIPMVTTLPANPLLDFNHEITSLREHCASLIARLKVVEDPVALLALHRAIDICTLSIFRLTRIHLIASPADAAQDQAIAAMTSLMRQVLAQPEPSTPSPQNIPAEGIEAAGSENSPA